MTASKPARSAPDTSARAGGSAALDRFVLTDIVSHLLRRAHFRAEEIFNEELGASGLTPRQKALLITAYQNPRANQNALAEKIAIDRNSFAEMLARMVARGYVRRDRSREDGRAYEITITEKGIRALDEVLPGDAVVEKRIMEPLPPELRPLFVKCLRMMVGLEK
jgi:DNA-binding MarR family transcriptional regulator